MMTYSLLNLLFFAVLLATALLAKKYISLKACMVALVIVVSLTEIFDPIMIAVGLVDYDTSKLLGLYWFGAPIEDFAYALFAVPFVAGMWHLLEPKSD